MSVHWSGKVLTVQVLFSRTGLATQILVYTDRTALLLDCGDGAVRDLLEAGVSLDSLAGVFLTHGHADHLGGLWGLLGYLRAEGRARPLGVWYPGGCEEVEWLLTSFLSAHAGSIPFQLSTYPLAAGDELSVGEFKGQAWKVEHRHSVAGRLLGPTPALGYRLEAGGEVVAYTGDTGLCPGLSELVRGADLALIEATWEERGPAGLHLSIEEAEVLAGMARRAFLVHRSDGKVLERDGS